MLLKVPTQSEVPRKVLNIVSGRHFPRHIFQHFPGEGFGTSLEPMAARKVTVVLDAVRDSEVSERKQDVVEELRVKNAAKIEDVLVSDCKNPFGRGTFPPFPKQRHRCQSTSIAKTINNRMVRVIAKSD